MFYFGILIYIGISYLIAAKIGRYKKIGFMSTLIICLLLTPFIGFLVAEGGRLEKPIGCKWCGNSENEAVYCGLCGKNANGEIREGFKKKSS